jgi:hypothetical protein
MTCHPNYYSPAAPINPRPTSVTVLAIIGIVWGAIMIPCNAITLIPFLGNLSAQDPVMSAIRADPVAYGWSVGSTVARVVLAVVLLAGGVGALMLKPAGRSGMLLYARVMIVLAVVDALMGVLVLFPIARNALSGNPQLASMLIARQVGAVFGIVIAMAYPILVLAFLNKAHVKAAFAGAGAGSYSPPHAAPPGYYPPQAQVPPGYYAPYYAPPGNYPPPQGPYGQQ